MSPSIDKGYRLQSRLTIGADLYGNGAVRY
jgi:hypothetical protein